MRLNKNKGKMQDDQQQQNSKNNETLSDSFKTSQQNVTAIEHSNGYVEKKDGTTKSKPAMCGTLLLMMGAEEIRRLSENNLQKSLERESHESKQQENSC